MNALMANVWDVTSRNATLSARCKNGFDIAIAILIRGFDALGEWQDRARERRQLMGMSDRGLGDLGLARTVIDAEAKPLGRSGGYSAYVRHGAVGRGALASRPAMANPTTKPLICAHHAMPPAVSWVSWKAPWSTWIPNHRAVNQTADR